MQQRPVGILVALQKIGSLVGIIKIVSALINIFHSKAFERNLKKEFHIEEQEDFGELINDNEEHKKEKKASI